MLLVVLWHVSRKHYDDLAWVPAQVEQAWLGVNLVMQPLRVPLFFAISGLLASRSIARPWRAVLRPRVLNGWWTYLVWLLVGTAFFAVGPPLGTSTPDDAAGLLVAAVLGGANVWYLHALAAYFVVSKACARLPLWVPLGAAAVLAVLADVPGVVPGQGNNYEAVLRNLVFFVVPALRPGVLTALVARARWRTALPAATGFLALSSALVAHGTAWSAGVRVLLGVLGVGAGMLLAVRAARARPAAADLLGRLGQRTLPVYVLHLPLLALLQAGVGALPDPQGPFTGLVAAAYPLLAVAVLTAGALAVHRALLAVGLGALFRLPASLPTMARRRR